MQDLAVYHHVHHELALFAINALQGQQLLNTTLPCKEKFLFFISCSLVFFMAMQGVVASANQSLTRYALDRTILPKSSRSGTPAGMLQKAKASNQARGNKLNIMIPNTMMHRMCEAVNHRLFAGIVFTRPPKIPTASSAWNRWSTDTVLLVHH